MKWQIRHYIKSSSFTLIILILIVYLQTNMQFQNENFMLFIIYLTDLFFFIWNLCLTLSESKLASFEKMYNTNDNKRSVHMLHTCLHSLVSRFVYRLNRGFSCLNRFTIIIVRPISCCSVYANAWCWRVFTGPMCSLNIAKHILMSCICTCSKSHF